MKQVAGLWIALSLGVVAEAADPPARPETIKPASTAASPASLPPVKLTKPLDLRVGDVRNYMMPKDYQASLGMPEADKNSVVVEGKRELVPMKMVEDVPPGLAGLWYAVKDPKNAWRLFAPVVHFEDGPPIDKVPPPVFRWGP